jgi:hypothetical protein
VQALSRASSWTEYGMMYPLVNGGFVPLLDRAVFNRPGRGASRRLMRCGVSAGNAVINCIPRRRGKALTADGGRGDGLREVRRQEVGSIENGEQQLRPTMPGIVAEIGRVQLRKLDFFNRRRVEMCEALMADLGCGYPRVAAGGDGSSTYSYLAMSFEGADIQRVRERCAERGLSLLCTWPGHQDYWPEQNTESVRRVRDSVLLWFVNPMVTGGEIEEMKNVLGEFARPRPALAGGREAGR